jgi:phage regulator Rha-like protein
VLKAEVKMDKNLLKYDADVLQSMIIIVRGRRVILSSDLAGLYGVEPKVLNQAVKRNERRFPADFVFKLTAEEAQHILRSRSQTVTLKQGTNIKYPPYAFTEHGAVMAANVLNSSRAVEMSVFVVRAFIAMRDVLAGNTELALQLAELEKHLTQRLNIHEKAIVHVLEKIKECMPAASQPSATQKRKIGFQQ